MNKLQELLGKLDALDDQLDKLLANDDLDDTQLAEHDRLVEERKKVQGAVERERARLAREEERARLEAETATTEQRRQQSERREARTVPGTARLTQPDQPAAGRATHTRLDEQGRVTGFFEDAGEELTIRFGDAADAIRRLGYRQQRKQCREQLRVAGYKPWGEFRSFADFVREGFSGSDRHSFQDRVNKHYAAVQGMSEGVGADGGYLVMPEFATGIVDRVYANTLWSMTDNYSVSGNNLTFHVNAETSRATGSRHGGMRGYWLAEGGAPTASKPTLREVTLRLQKLGVLVYLTQELIDDGGAALQEYVARKAAEEFNFMIGDSLVNGTGVGQPLGMLNFPSLVSVAKESGQLADTLETENVEKMYARFYAPGLPGMVWLHNQDIAPELNTMTLGIGTGGVPTYLPPGQLSSAPFGTLKGRPLMPTEFNSTLGDQGDIIAANLGQILSISKGGVAQQVSMHVQFLTQQTALLFTMRLNAGPWENAPITPYKGTSNTQSNFVTLDARA